MYHVSPSKVEQRSLNWEEPLTTSTTDYKNFAFMNNVDPVVPGSPTRVKMNQELCDGRRITYAPKKAHRGPLRNVSLFDDDDDDDDDDEQPSVGYPLQPKRLTFSGDAYDELEKGTHNMMGW